MANDLRGRFDRKLTPAQRAARRRIRILEGCARALQRYGPVELTVSRILETSKVGRNSFYEAFDDAADAASATQRYATAALLAEVDARLAACRTPHTRVRELVVAWTEAASARPHFGHCTACDLGAGKEADFATAALAKRVEDLWQQAYRDGATGRRPEGDRAWHLGAALAAAGARAARRRELRRQTESLIALLESALR